MNIMSLKPKQESEYAKEFLFACAFWTIAADEQLNEGEQSWLSAQFGDAESKTLLDQFLQLESNRFFDVFDSLAAALTPEERNRIFPALDSWLHSCSASDSAGEAHEKDVITELWKRLDRFKPAPAPPSPKPVAKAPLDKSDSTQARQIPPAAQAADRLPLKQFRGHMSAVTAVCFHKNGHLMYSASEDGTIKCWDVAAGTATRSFDRQDAGVTAMTCSTDGTRIVSGNRAGVVSLRNAENGDILWSVHLKKQGGVTGVDLSPDGKSIVVALEVGLIHILMCSDGDEFKSFGKRGSMIHDCRFSPEGFHVLTGDDDKVLRLWDVATGTEKKSLQGHSDGVLSVQFSRDGKMALSASRDNSVKIWNIATGDVLISLSGHTFTVSGALFCKNDKFVVSSSLDHTVRVWEIESGRQVCQRDQFTGGFLKPAIHPNGKDAAAGCSDACVYLIPGIFE